MKQAVPEYRIIRSDRKSVALQVRPEGLIVRAPKRMSDRQIKAFVESRSDWIAAHTAKMQAAQQAAVQPLTDAEIRALAAQARREIPPRVAYYASRLGVTYGRITIRCQRSRWGSCSAKGNLNFNCLLMLTPPEVRDSVIVHELCHRREMNHSAAFYRLVCQLMPDYPARNRWLKENGTALMLRLSR
ncbi:MAG: M48 family metallopeptidase [Clostridia bacterium]|nr:M48 family metallopeptidase [Clostridia bacterium]